MLYALSIRTLRMLIIVFNFWPGISNTLAMSGSDVCFASSDCAFCCLYAYDFLSVAGHDVPGKKNCYKLAFSNVVVVLGEEGVLYSPMVPLLGLSLLRSLYH